MRRVNECLNPQLVQICLQNFQVDKVNEIFQSMLPKHLQNHCRVSSFIRGKLLISVSDATFATELRYLIPTIRDNLRREHQIYQLIQCDLIIDDQQGHSLNITKKNQTRKVSENVKQAVESLAEMVDYQPLKNVIKKWSENLKTK